MDFDDWDKIGEKWSGSKLHLLRVEPRFVSRVVGYSVKGLELSGASSDWAAEVALQLKNKRLFSAGGLFRPLPDLPRLNAEEVCTYYWNQGRWEPGTETLYN